MVPINDAIDDAPDRIISINQTVLILFGAAITYKFFNDRKDTFFDLLVKAQGRYLADNEGWIRKSTKQKRESVAGIILNFYARRPRTVVQ